MLLLMPLSSGDSLQAWQKQIYDHTESFPHAALYTLQQDELLMQEMVSMQSQHYKTEPEPYTTSAQFIAVGDIMMHSPQVPSGYDAATDTYQFDAFFREVAPILKEGDWVYGNLETPLAGRERGFHGYPLFNAPDELADALKQSGFTVLSTANNHSLDQGIEGLRRTLEQLQDKELTAIGTHLSLEDANDITFIKQHDINMAFLSYTYGTNGIPIPEEMAYAVQLIEEERIIQHIQTAVAQQADVVTVALHFGAEYVREPSEAQKELAHRFIQAGADIILGSHPHVVHPYEVVTTTDEDGHPREGIILYSLGNFISNQGPAQGTPMYTDVGIIFNITIEKSFPDHTITFPTIESIPTWVHKFYDNGKRQYRVLPIETFLANKDDSFLREDEYTLMERYMKEMDEHVHQYILETPQ